MIPWTWVTRSGTICKPNWGWIRGSRHGAVRPCHQLSAGLPGRPFGRKRRDGSGRVAGSMPPLRRTLSDRRRTQRLHSCGPSGGFLPVGERSTACGMEYPGDALSGIDKGAGGHPHRRCDRRSRLRPQHVRVQFGAARTLGLASSRRGTSHVEDGADDGLQSDGTQAAGARAHSGQRGHARTGSKRTLPIGICGGRRCISRLPVSRWWSISRLHYAKRFRQHLSLAFCGCSTSSSGCTVRMDRQ